MQDAPDTPEGALRTAAATDAASPEKSAVDESDPSADTGQRIVDKGLAERPLIGPVTAAERPYWRMNWVRASTDCFS